MKLYQKVILCCLLAPIFHINFSNLFIYGIDVAMGFKPEKITYFGVLGCYKETWMYLVMNTASFSKSIILLLLGYFLSKKPNENFKLLGALVLFYIPFGYVWDLGALLLFKVNPFNKWMLNEEWKQLPMFIFKTFYNYKLIFNFLALTYSIVSLYLCYKTIRYYWNPHFRFLIFTLGVMVSAASTILWYMCIGPLIY
jgi:hypothetical protein